MDKIRIIIALAIVALIAIVFWYYGYFSKKEGLDTIYSAPVKYSTYVPPTISYRTEQQLSPVIRPPSTLVDAATRVYNDQMALLRSYTAPTALVRVQTTPTTPYVQPTTSTAKTISAPTYVYAMPEVTSTSKMIAPPTYVYY